jgi:hypothetical protein
MMTLAALLALVAIGQALWIAKLRRDLKHLAAAAVVNAQLAHEVERRYGQKKALRLIRSASVQIAQRRKASEV